MSDDTPEIVLSEDARRGVTAGLMFRGSRDFLLAYRLLGLRRRAPEVRDGKAPGPLQSWVTCASLALELALKCRIVLDGKPAPWTHKYVDLFGELSRGAQEDVASKLLIEARPAIVEELFEILAGFENPFERWRYLHERLATFQETRFHEGNMVAVIRAVYASIVGVRNDFRPWPGVIWDASVFDEVGMPRWP